MKKKEKYRLFVDYFKKAIPNPKTELKFNSPFELLVAVVLSAQCTDVRVNKTTPHLFKKYPNAKKLSKASLAYIPSENKYEKVYDAEIIENEIQIEKGDLKNE